MRLPRAWRTCDHTTPTRVDWNRGLTTTQNGYHMVHSVCSTPSFGRACAKSCQSRSVWAEPNCPTYKADRMHTLASVASVSHGISLPDRTRVRQSHITMGRLRLSWRYITVFTVYLTTIFTKVTGTERFELELSSFRNALALDNQGNCCGTGSPGQCTSRCETFFRICLLEYMRDIPSDLENTHRCTFGELTTPVLGDNSFDIPSGPSEENNFDNPIRIRLNFVWPGTFTLMIQAFHDVTSLGPTQGSERQILTRVAFQQFLNVSSEWTNRTHVEEDQRQQLDFSYRVVCEEHYYGPTCSNNCRPKNDSLGHWRCDQNGQKVCLDGWEGDFCTTAICTEGCQHGTCSSAPGTCSCQYSWEGALCDQCIPYDGCVNGYCDKTPWECICNPGWGDLLCDQDLYYCYNHQPCRNGATCVNGGPEGFTCFCAPGFTGIDCSTAVQCSCRNGGTCQSTEQGYACVCPAGFSGRDCEFILPMTCCSNGGTCITTQDGQQCLCPEGYFGNRCENRNYCISNPCVNDGTCVNTLSGFSCVCPNGYAGDTCNTNVCDGMCRNGGTCVADFDTLRCVCPRTFTGAQCETQLSECLLNAPCAHGVTCVDHETDGYECLCPDGFTGRNCTVATICRSSHCLNGGTCSPDPINPLDFVCGCAPGWIGKTCGIPEGADVTTPASFTTARPSPPPGTTADDLPSKGGGDKDVEGTKTPYHRPSEGLSDVTQIAIYVSFGVLIIILIIILIIVVYRRQHVDHHHHQGRAVRDTDKGTDSTPNNRHMYRDNFSQEEKVLPLLSISSKVCNTESDNFSKSKCKDYSAKETYHESLPVEKLSTQECMSYVQRHSLPKVDTEDNYYYYDEKASQLKRTESLHSTCQSAESTPRHNVKCSIVQISAVIEDSNPKSVHRNYSVHLNEGRSTPVRLHATEV